MRRPLPPHDPVAPNVVKLIPAHSHAQAGKTISSAPTNPPSENPAAIHVIDSIILDAQIHEAAGFLVAH